VASLDDIYDMIQKLDDNNIEYLLITIQKGKKNGKADVFYSLKDKNSMRILTKGLNEFSKEVDRIDDEGKFE
jgi:hypothetical protein